MSDEATLEANKQIFRRWFEEAWNKGNFDIAEEIIDPNFVVHGAGGQVVPTGHEGVKQLITAWRTAFPDGQMEVHDLIAEGDKVVALLTWRGTHLGDFAGIAPTGNKIEVTSIGIDRIENGKITEGWGEVDMLSMMQQMGVVPKLW